MLLPVLFLCYNESATREPGGNHVAKSKRKPNNRGLVLLLTLLILAAGVYLNDIGIDPQSGPRNGTSSAADVTLQFPSDRYPETAKHIKAAILADHSPICTIDRAGAEENRKASLQGVPAKKGMDRDEWPMAMCAEGGASADIAYVSPKDNRGAGSWVGNQLEDYPDGTRVAFIVP